MAHPVLLVIVGPTAVGKTDICLRLAQHYGTEILSTDSRQFYRELNIGTAKPTPAELQQVPHHLINSLSIQHAYDVKQFENDALSILRNLFKQSSLVIAAGGSGLYVKTLCEGIDSMPDITDEARAYWSEQRDKKGLGFLLEELQRVDPIYFQKVDRQNHRRVQRALEVFRSVGQPFSAFRQQTTAQPRFFKVIKIGLTRQRESLYQRINQRVDHMLDAGLEAEARELFPYQNLNALHTVGYQEWFPYFEGQYDRAEAIRLIKRNSRRYAKRQWTWFRKDPDIRWFDAQEPATQMLSQLTQYINQQLSS